MCLLRPLNLSASHQDGLEVELNWMDVTQLEKGYVIERAENTTFEQIGTVDADVTTYTDPNVNNLNSYTYRIYAFNDNLHSLYSDTASITIATFAISQRRITDLGDGPDGNPVIHADYSYIAIEQVDNHLQLPHDICKDAIGCGKE